MPLSTVVGEHKQVRLSGPILGQKQFPRMSFLFLQILGPTTLLWVKIIIQAQTHRGHEQSQDN